MRRIKDHSLYLVLSSEYAKEKDIIDIAKTAIDAGIDILQMREKNKSPQELESLGKKLSSLCKDSDTIFIVNDDPHLAKRVEADGVHLGQEDLKKYPLNEVCAILGEGKIIGLSTHSLEELKKANDSDCDYMSFGPIFKTQAKDYSIGTDDIGDVLKLADKPVVFIGGINLTNIESVLERGAKNIALIRALLQAEDLASKIKAFQDKIKPSQTT